MTEFKQVKIYPKKYEYLFEMKEFLVKRLCLDPDEYLNYTLRYKDDEIALKDQQDLDQVKYYLSINYRPIELIVEQNSTIFKSIVKKRKKPVLSQISTASSVGKRNALATPFELMKSLAKMKNRDLYSKSELRYDNEDEVEICEKDEEEAGFYPKYNDLSGW